MAEFSFDLLRRRPDVEAPNLFAVDASDRLILDEAAEALASAKPGEVAVLGDRYGALTLGAAALHGATGIRVYQDALVGERALDRNAAEQGFGGAYTSHPLDAGLLDGARVVLLQLPRSLAELGEWAEAIARLASPDVVVVAGGRIKHMTLAMNEVLAGSFGRVDVGRARQKSRTLTATLPRTAAATAGYPVRREVSAPELPGGRATVVAHGGAFAGAALDIGTRFLLGFVAEMGVPSTDSAGRPRGRTAHDAIDLGSGTGLLAVALAATHPELRVVAIDSSRAAVASTTATAEANGAADRIVAVREDALFERPDESADLIVCNPPFHSGATVQAEVALRLLEDAGRVLRPGGELWTVFNTHLAYRDALVRMVGPTNVAGRGDKFTVTVSRKPV
ncbi:class I SAM-dependent methyltransferase [Amnibacterium flavum]|uniref:SAM-dependent methyltransferase n=1 Tax=Amnibacterium flavum TaxID=2173173 RepID=A0A2V1HTK2_9MICO|nr:methyltransferase [Amnibacterium flavum]PVZ93424.1 SAM-dependent methyltransferase [Amnibacterium flavum]